MAEASTPIPPLTRFAVFELDARAGELRKNGVKLKLEGQPLQILVLLLERPGQLVTREELREKLWAGDTFVDFEHSINTAIKKLRQALDDSAETPRFIETLPRRGYRFIYPVQVPGTEAPPEVTKPAGLPRRRRVAYGLVGVLTLAAVLGIGSIPGLRTQLPAPAINSVAVLPLENLTGDSEQEYMVDGLHDELVTQMAQITELTVISRTSVLGFKRTKKSIREIARELNGVDAVIEGAVRREGGRLRVTAQLIDTASDRHLWARSYERQGGDLALLPKEIVLDVAAALHISLNAREQKELKPGRPVDADVYTAYQKGRYHLAKWTNEGVWQAIRYFQQALDRDPTYAPAWAGMGEAYESLGSFAKGKDLSAEDARAKAVAALQRAVELDPRVKEPYQALARIKRRDGDWEGAAREFELARRADPSWLGPETYLLATGRYDEAVAAARKTAQTSPLAYDVQLVYGYTCFLAGHYDESITQLKKTVQLNPGIHYAHYELAWNYVRKGMLKESAAECDTALALLHDKQPEENLNGPCGSVYAAAGRRQQALQMAGKLAAGKPGRQFLALAKIYDALGDRERALSYLRQAEDRLDSAVPLRDNPFLSDQLKADPRFQKIARRQKGFPPATGALAEVRAQAPPLPESPRP